MALDEILREPPKIHAWRAGKLISMGLPRDFFIYIADQVNPASRTLETGVGISTVVFALKQAQHTCVAPDDAEIERLKVYCQVRGISTDSINFQIMYSHQFFQHWIAEPLDLVLIDGGHGFPTPFIDWFYTAGSIRVGGVVVIDDAHLWTGAVLKEFLLAEPEWRLTGPRSPKTAAFTKTADYIPWKEWTQQPYVANRSEPRRYSSRLKSVLHLARTGQYATLVKKILKHFPR